MIIFYNKQSGKIVGSIGGRKHYKGEQNFWIGPKDTTDRILYLEGAPYFEEIVKDPLFITKYKVNLLSLTVEKL